ncbi:MAG: cupin domain-containing protein [Promethearchaeota archaeon]|jgi:mannose-6-phosphate isomerase-like protein (cupin superfamily)
MESKLRRVITGHNEAGKSVVAYDGPPIETGIFPEIWVTDGSPADNKHKNDSAKRKERLEPPANGSIIRFFQLQPEDPSMSAEELEKALEAGFAALDASHCRPDTSRNPGMHKTKTVDYIILLEGEVTLLLDKDEVDLKPFDVVVQRGTNHAWINKGSNPALLVGVLIDAEPI